jgi:hypothetical protein
MPSKDPYDDLPSAPPNAGGFPGDDPADGDWHPPMEKDPPMPARIARELAEMPPDETGTQAFWRQTLRHEPMPVTGPRAGQGATSDTAPLPPPYAPVVDPMARNADKPAPTPGTTGGTMDTERINRLPPAAPGVPGTRDQPTQPHFHFRSPESAPPDPNEILYTEADDTDHSSGPSLGGHLGAINA